MRFRRGNKVEVMNKKDLPSGSWREAEIVFGNGHTYHVQYVNRLTKLCLGQERVPRNSIRPCPPPMQSLRNWVPGDLVEVLVNGSWKPAKVSRVVEGGNHLYVELRAPLMELKVRVSDLRPRQAWIDGEWIVIGKESQKGNGTISIPPKVVKFGQCHPMVKKCKDDKFLGNNGKCLEETYQLSLCGTKKRRLFSSPFIETYGRAGRKSTTTKNKGKRQRLAVGHSSQLPEMMIGEKYMHSSFNNNMTTFPELGTAWGNPADDTIFFSVGSLEASDSESLSSSVGSSSPIYIPYRSANHLKTSPAQDDGTQSGSRGKHSSGKEGLKGEIHQLELNAYRSTMVALYASGPLSWEREDMLTNLRLMLNITNDEHLLELRHLASMKNVSA